MEIKNVLLTGAGGLVGRTLAPLLQADYDVTGFDIADPGIGLPCIVGDLRTLPPLWTRARARTP